MRRKHPGTSCWSLLFVLVAAFGLAGCGDGNGDLTCDPACDPDQCMVCADDGCVSSCTADQVCDSGTCITDTTCTDGETRCEGNVVQTCATGTWTITTDCTTTGQTCQVDNGVAQCRGGVNCTAGDTQTCTCAGGVEGVQYCNADGSAWGVCSCGGGRKIVAPPSGGIYLGHAESMPGARASFESTTGKKVAIWQRFDVIHGQEEDPSQHALSFDLAVAQQAWDQGYIVFASAFEAYPGHSSFTVDKLLAGTYDADLATLAGQFKEFGKPMFFSTAREPNVVLSDYLGGFGPDGDQSTAWAYENERTTGDFTPPAGPAGSPDLFVGLGDSEACDGLERLAAAQRYYYDFFVRREGIDFLTFDTMGWNAGIGAELEADAWTVPCGNLRAFHGMLVGYADWVSINTYFDTDDVIPLPTVEKYVADLDKFMNEVIRGGPLASLPVMITELGFCGADVPSKIAQGLDAIVSDYPEIGALIFWGDDSNIGLECLVDPGPEADAFNSVMTANPDSFHSCVTFSDGTSPPGCQ